MKQSNPDDRFSMISNEEIASTEFDWHKRYLPCGVCLSEQLAHNFVMYNCGHFMCVYCYSDYKSSKCQSCQRDIVVNVDSYSVKTHDQPVNRNSQVQDKQSEHALPSASKDENIEYELVSVEVKPTVSQNQSTQ